MTEELLTSETPEEKTYFENKGDVPEKAAETPAEQPADAGEPAPEEKPAETPVAKLVPYEAMKEERDKRKYWQGEATKRGNEAARTAGRMEVLERLAHDARRPEPEAAKELDPLAKLERADKYIEDRTRADQHEAAKRELVTWYAADASEFTAAAPDFQAAYDYVSGHRLHELQLMGWSPAQAQEILHGNELAIAQQARAQGRSAAQVVYEMAKHRGYAGPKPETKPESKQTPEEKLATVESGQKAAKSLSQAAGSPAKSISMESLMSMDDEEFDKATSGKKWKDLWEPRR